MRHFLKAAVVALTAFTPTDSFANPAAAALRAASTAGRTATAPRMVVPGARSTRLASKPIHPRFENRTDLGDRYANILLVMENNPERAFRIAARVHPDDSEFFHFQFESRDDYSEEADEYRTLTSNVLRACEGKGPALSFVANSVQRIAYKVRTRAYDMTVEDLAQSFWLKFEGMCRSFEARSEGQTYGLIFRILNNIASDHLQLRATQVFRNASGDDGAVDTAMAEVGLPHSDTASDREVLDAVTVLSQALTLREREALALRVMGYTYQESADLMHISKDRVKELLSSARTIAGELDDELNLFSRAAPQR